MMGEELYGLYREKLEDEGVDADGWEDLDGSDCVAWGAVAWLIVAKEPVRILIERAYANSGLAFDATRRIGGMVGVDPGKIP